MTNPLPRHLRQAIAEADWSSPVPLHSGHTVMGSNGSETRPVPPQTVHVRLFTAPVPLQWGHGVLGVRISTEPLPPQTQHVEIHDMIPKGSFPVPLQKEQVISSVLVDLVASSGICFPWSSTDVVGNYFLSFFLPIAEDCVSSFAFISASALAFRSASSLALTSASKRAF